VLFHIEENYRLGACHDFGLWVVYHSKIVVSFQVCIGCTLCVCVCVCVCSFRTSGSFMMSVCVCVCLTFKVFVCCGGECELWCPDIRGGVVIGSQGDGGFRRSMPDRGGVCWCFFGIRYIGDRVVGGGVVVIG